MRHILEAVYGFVTMILVTGVAICQALTQSLNSLEVRITERGKARCFFCIIFWEGYYVY